MTPATKLGYRRFIYSGVVFASVFAMFRVVGIFVPEGPIDLMLGVVLMLYFACCFVYIIWIVWFWKPICPNCKSARTRFIAANGTNERLVCKSCGFDEPTGFQRGGA